MLLCQWVVFSLLTVNPMCIILLMVELVPMETASSCEMEMFHGPSIVKLINTIQQSLPRRAEERKPLQNIEINVHHGLHTELGNALDGHQ